MAVAVDRTPDVDLNEEPCKLNRGRHMGQRGVEFPPLSFSICLFVSPPLWCHPTFLKTNLQHRVLGDSFLATASKQTDSSLLWCKMRSQCMRKKAGEGSVGFADKPTVQLGSLCFFDEEWTRNRRASKMFAKTNGEHLLLSLSCNNLIPVCRGCSVTTHHSEYLHTFLFPICSLSLHRICSRSLARYLFLFSIHYTPSIFSAHINLTPHSK